jgi:hypothetical protein
MESFLPFQIQLEMFWTERGMWTNFAAINIFFEQETQNQSANPHPVWPVNVLWLT